MSEPLVDLSYQARLGLDYTLPLLGGGTGRVDGGAPLTIVPAQNVSGSTISKGAVLRKSNVYPSGPAFLVTPVTAVTDLAIAVAVESIPDNETGAVAILGSPVIVLTTGTVNDGSLLVPSSTSGRAKASTGALTEVAFAIALSAATGTSQVWAILVGLFPATLNYTQFPGSVTYIIGDGTNIITTGQKGHIRWPFAGTLLRASLLADAVGSIVVDIWKDTYANFPPVVADSITASAKPTLSSAQKSEDSTLTGWTKTFLEGDIYAFNVDTSATVKRVSLELKWQRT